MTKEVKITTKTTMESLKMNFNTKTECLKTDDKTKNRLVYMLENGDMEKNAHITFKVKELLLCCSLYGFTVSVRKEKVQVPASPLPTNYYYWQIKDEQGKVLGEFEMARHIYPKSLTSVKGREFLKFIKKVNKSK